MITFNENKDYDDEDYADGEQTLTWPRKQQTQRFVACVHEWQHVQVKHSALSRRHRSKTRPTYQRSSITPRTRQKHRSTPHTDEEEEDDDVDSMMTVTIALNIK